MPVTLLLADDSATIQRVIEMTFAQEDVRVVTVGDGREAIEHIAADPPDIVLADTNMPETDGYEVSAFVKADPARSGIPVVLLTGAFEPVDDGRAREAGCDAVLVKPFEPKAVLGRVRELLGLPADAATAPADAATAPFDGPAAPADAGEDRAADEASGGAADEPSPAPVAAAPPAAADAAAESSPDPSEPLSADAEPPSAAEAPPATLGEPGGGPDVEPAAAPAASAPGGGAAPPAVPAVEAPAPPSLADAFASLLAAEQGDLDRARAAYPWPRQTVPPGEDDLVERVTERVVERLSNDVTGELVSEVVARVAERLVRDQIDRIRPA